MVRWGGCRASSADCLSARGLLRAFNDTRLAQPRGGARLGRPCGFPAVCNWSSGRWWCSGCCFSWSMGRPARCRPTGGPDGNSSSYAGRHQHAHSHAQSTGHQHADLTGGFAHPHTESQSDGHREPDAHGNRQPVSRSHSNGEPRARPTPTASPVPVQTATATSTASPTPSALPTTGACACASVGPFRTRSRFPCRSTPTAPRHMRCTRSRRAAAARSA